MTTADPLEPRARAWVVALWVLLLFVVSVVAAGVAGLWGFLVECGVFGPSGAYASPQGGVCGERESAWNALPLAAWIVGAVVPPAAALLAYRKFDGVAAAVAGLGALLMCPFLVALLVTAPSDECSTEQRRDLPRWACSVADGDETP